MRALLFMTTAIAISCQSVDKKKRLFEEDNKGNTLVSDKVGDITSDSDTIFVNDGFILACDEALEDGEEEKAKTYRALMQAVKTEGCYALSLTLDIKNLSLSGQGITEVTPIAFFNQLEDLDLSNNKISGFEELSQLSKLRRLNLSYNSDLNIEDISYFDQLTFLNLSNCGISDLSPVSALTQITNLDLSSNNISDAGLSALGDLTQVIHLNLSAQTPALVSIENIAGFTNLKTLDVSNNRITAVNTIAQFSELEELNGSNNRISTLMPLQNTTQLKKVYLQANDFSFAQYLSKNAGLTDLDLSSNSIIPNRAYCPIDSPSQVLNDFCASIGVRR